MKPDPAPRCPETGEAGFTRKGAQRTRDRINALLTGGRHYVKTRRCACGWHHVRLLPRREDYDHPLRHQRPPVPPSPPLQG